WMQAVDDHTRMGFACFLKSRDKIKYKLQGLMNTAKTFDYRIRIFRCDNAGENTRHLMDIAMEFGIKMEYTSPYTPPMNGVVERRIAVLKLRAQAMLNQADLTTELRNK